MGPLASAGWLRDRIGSDGAADPDLAVVDVRFDLLHPESGRAAYEEGHVPGAVFADMAMDLAATPNGRNGRHPLPDPKEAAGAFGRLGIGDGVTVVAYDGQSGMFAARLWWMLRWLGHERVAVLDGGLPAWTAAGGRLRPGVETRPARRFPPRPVAALSADVGEVAAGLDRGTHLLVDAREPVRWRGETEPFDPVAGRIPGATNFFWRDNLGSDGRFLPKEALARRFAPEIGTRDGRRIVCYCGSGISAAHDALALFAAGIPDAAVYAGSWSEWCADPARPVGRGERIEEPKGQGP